MTLDIAPRRPPQPPAQVGRNDRCPCKSGRAMCERSDRRLAKVVGEFGLERLGAIKAMDN